MAPTWSIEWLKINSSMLFIIINSSDEKSHSSKERKYCVKAKKEHRSRIKKKKKILDISVIKGIKKYQFDET